MEKSKEELGRLRQEEREGIWESRTDSEEETEGRHRDRSEGFECHCLETTYSLIFTNNSPQILYRAFELPYPVTFVSTDAFDFVLSFNF